MIVHIIVSSREFCLLPEEKNNNGSFSLSPLGSILHLRSNVTLLRRRAHLSACVGRSLTDSPSPIRTDAQAQAHLARGFRAPTRLNRDGRRLRSFLRCKLNTLGDLFHRTENLISSSSDIFACGIGGSREQFPPF